MVSSDTGEISGDGNKKQFWRKPLDLDTWSRPQGKLTIVEDRCKGCGFCIEFCPKDVLKESNKLNSKGYHPPEVSKEEECTGCSLCERICPEFAIFVEKIIPACPQTDKR